MFMTMRRWLERNTKEVIVLYFGELHYENDTYPKLLEVRIAK
jgi:hypothetical protein